MIFPSPLIFLWSIKLLFFNSHPSTPHLENRKSKETGKNITTELGDLSIGIM